MIDKLVGEIIERYEGLSRELSDPAIYDDQARYADVSRAHSVLSEPHRLALEYAEAMAAAEEADALLDEGALEPDMKEFLTEERTAAREKMTALEEEIRVAMLEKDPRDEKNVIVEVALGRRGRRGRSLRRRDLPHAHALRRAAAVQDRDPLDQRVAPGRAQGDRLRHQGQGRVRHLQVRVGRAPGAAGAGDRVDRAHPHLDGDGGRAARGGGGRRGHRPQRAAHRRLPLHRTGRPVGQHHRLRRAHHARPHGPGGVVPGREVAAAEQGAGAPHPARAAAGERPGREGRRGVGAPAAARWAPASGPRRSARTTSRRAG